MLCKAPIWFLVGSHCLFLYFHKVLHLDLGMIVIGEDNLTTGTTGLIVFFLVFYGSQCYTRYFTLYSACMDMSGAVQSWVGLCRVYFPTASAEVLWNLCRHVVASVYFLYFELGGGGVDRVITEAEWSVLFRSSLVNEEVQRPQRTSFSPLPPVQLPSFITVPALLPAPLQ